MNARFVTTTAALGSAALLLGALGFQYLGELPPCKMCYWQRYPHMAAALIGVLCYWRYLPVLAWLGATATAITAAIGIFHAGVERALWEGPSTCSSGSIEGLSADALLSQIMNAPLVRCDEVAWSVAGISMAGWNAIFSIALVGLWVLSTRVQRG